MYIAFHVLSTQSMYELLFFHFFVSALLKYNPSTEQFTFDAQ